MKCNFTLSDIKPFSINAMYYGDGRTKSQKYYNWSFRVFDRISQEQVQQVIRPLRENFDPKKHGIVVRLTAYYPKKVFYRKAGGVSAKTMDLSNWEKPLIDCLFLPKHHTNKPPYGSPNLNLDDRYIISLTSQKKITEEENPFVRVYIKVTELDRIF